MTTILAIGDIHIQTKTLSDSREMLKKLVETVKDKKPDIIVLLGDILHTHETVNTHCLNHAKELFGKLSAFAPLYVLVGNHDFIKNDEFMTERHWMNSFKDSKYNITICDRTTPLKVNGNLIYMVPYVPPTRFKEALMMVNNETNNEEWKNAGCIFAHQEFYGCKFETGNSSEGDKWLENDPFVVSGHIHKKHWLAPNLYYTGSVMQHSFGEDSNKSVFLMTFSDNKMINSEEIDLQLPKYFNEYCKLEDLDNVIIPENNDKLKLHITCEPGEFSTFKKSKEYKKLSDTGVKVVIKTLDNFNRKDNPLVKNLIDNGCCGESDDEGEAEGKEGKEGKEVRDYTFKNVLYSLIKDDDIMLEDYKNIIRY